MLLIFKTDELLFSQFCISSYSANVGSNFLKCCLLFFFAQDIGRVTGPPVLNPIANEVYLNFESSTPCLADKHFNYTSLIVFHCKRGVSMVSVPLFTVWGLALGLVALGRPSRKRAQLCARSAVP